MVSQVPATTIQAGGVSWVSQDRTGGDNVVFSVLTVESCSVTLTQTVVAIQDSAQSCCHHLTKLTALIRCEESLPHVPVFTSSDCCIV